MFRLFVPFIILLAAISIALVADRPRPRADFTFLSRADITTLDVQQMSWQHDLRLARSIFEGLVKNDVFDPDYAIAPGVAESWDLSPDKRTYTFHLRDAKWSDGSPVTPDDFFYAWMRSVLPDLGTDYAGFVEHIKGANEFARWRTSALADFSKSLKESSRSADPHAAEELWIATKQKFHELVAVRAPNKNTIRMELERPTPYFLELAAFPTMAPLPRRIVEKYEYVDDATGRVRWDPAWTKPPVYVSNGPFYVESWQFKRDLRLRRNPHYWNQAQVHLDTISTPNIEDPVSSVMAFKTGAVDWVTDVSAPFRAEMVAQKKQFYSEHKEQYEALKAEGLDPIEIDRRLPADPRKNIHILPAFGTYFWNFNCSPKLPDGRTNPLVDPRVRRALAMSIDKTAIADGIRRLGEKVASTLIPPDSIPSYKSPVGLVFDPKAARALLAEAGYPDGKGFITLDLLVTKDGGHELIAQAMAKDWERHLNIETTINVQEVLVFRERLKNKNYMVSRASWFGDYGDPTTFLEINRSTDGNNDRAYSSPSFDALLNHASVELDPRARMKILSEAERVLVEEDLPLLPIFSYVNLYLFDANKVAGLNPHPRAQQIVSRVDILHDGKGANAPIPQKKRESLRNNQGSSPAKQ